MKKTKNSIKIFAVLIICFSFIITASAADSLVPLGNSVGIAITSDGAMVTGLLEDMVQNPCKEAGIEPGDVIKSVDGKEVHTNVALKKAVEQSGGKPIKIEYLRDGKTYSVTVTPQKCDSGEYIIGVRIRDGIAGVGTMTYYDPKDGSFGALGHGVSDSETNVLMPIEDGYLLHSSVASVKKGKVQNPGELIGEYNTHESFADIKTNTDCGIFGKIRKGEEPQNISGMPVAKKDEIKRGEATILSNIEGTEVKEYAVEITSIYFDGEKTKNMMIRVTDPVLLEKTGGIVRGMSGSPIIQDGKIVGAITHVLVNNPTKGYAIFIENMLAEAAE